MNVTITRANQFLLFGVLLVVVLYFARPILSLVALAAMLAMLMCPMARWLEGKGAPRVLSSLTCVVALLLVIVGILGLVSTQVVRFSKDIPKMEKKAEVLLDNVQDFVQDKFKMSPREQTNFVKKQIDALGKSTSGYIGKVLGGITGTFAGIVLALIFTFLFLFKRENYESFFIKLFKEVDAERVKEILTGVTGVSQQYLTGRAISMSIQAVLFSVGLLIIGIKNAILLGCLAALLTILPYVGPVVGGLFPVLMSLVTEDSLQPTLWVIGLLFLIQGLDNYFIEPNVVGGNVRLNASATILIIIVGGTLWGVLGMVLFTPLLGMFMVLCEHVEPLKPYTYLLGEGEGKRVGRRKK